MRHETTRRRPDRLAALATRMAEAIEARDRAGALEILRPVEHAAHLAPAEEEAPLVVLGRRFALAHRALLRRPDVPRVEDLCAPTPIRELATCQA